jgi:hypothetical protein
LRLRREAHNAQLRWPFGVDSLTLSGRALADGHAVRERITPS